VSIAWALILIVVAFATVMVSYGITYFWVGAKPFDRMGAGDWKFSESWASTLTALGGILGAILAAQVLPSETTAEKLASGSFVVFNLMFAVVVVVATAVYNTLRFQQECVEPPEGTPSTGETPKVEPPPKTEGPLTPEETEKAAETKKVFEYQGFVVCFLVASALVLWAVLGQLLTAWYLLDEVPDDALSDPVHTIFEILLALAAALALVYGATSVPWTLLNQAYRDEIGTGPQNKQQPRTRSNWYLI
jgi:flagellar basal body-associated protein FliL